MAESNVVDLTEGTRTLLRALQGRIARKIQAGENVPKGEVRELVALTERVERIRPTLGSTTVDVTHGHQCARCGEIHERCAGHRGDGKPCRRWPTHGAVVCFKHGAGAPQVKAAAVRRLAEAEVRAHRGIPLDVEPHEAALDMVREAAGNVAMFRARMADDEHTRHGYDYGGKPYTNPTVVAYDAERDRLARFCKLASDMRIDETRVRLAQAQGQALAVVVLAAVNACNPDDEERAAALRAAGAHMRAIGAGEALPVAP